MTVFSLMIYSLWSNDAYVDIDYINIGSGDDGNFITWTIVDL